MIIPMNDYKFAVLILTHGRANNVITYNTLRRCGYTGEIWIVIDNEDSQADEYRRIYGDKVVMFDKPEIASRFDEGDNFHDRRAIIYARNASFEIAEKLGLDYFVQMDDDYTGFRYRFNQELIYKDKAIKDLNSVFEAVINFYCTTPAASVAMGQGGDFLGGSAANDVNRLWLKRKCMNAFFCATDRRFPFMGRINEDVNTYVTLGNRGSLFFTFFNISLEQRRTQSNPGGMTEMYLGSGTYVKSFYAVMYSPSCVKVTAMPSKWIRIHHRVNWDNAVPKIVSESLRKADD